MGFKLWQSVCPVKLFQLSDSSPLNSFRVKPTNVQEFKVLSSSNYLIRLPLEKTSRAPQQWVPSFQVQEIENHIEIGYYHIHMIIIFIYIFLFSFQVVTYKVLFSQKSMWSSPTVETAEVSAVSRGSQPWPPRTTRLVSTNALGKTEVRFVPMVTTGDRVKFLPVCFKQLNWRVGGY